MEPLKLLSLAGFILIVAGLLLMVAQFIWPEHFLGITKTFDGLGVKLQTNEVGFGVIVIGAVLMLAATFGSRRQSQVNKPN
jgi:hypothetical protein